MSDSEDDQPDWDYGESKGAAVYGPCLDASHSKRIADLERENERLRDGLKSQSAVLSRIDYICGEPNDMEVSGYDVHCNEDAVLVAVKKLRAQLETAEALLRRVTEVPWQCRSCHRSIEGTGEDICYTCLQVDRDQWKRTAEQLRQESEALTADNEALRLDNAALLRIKATSNALEAQLEAERDLARQEREKVWADFLRVYEMNKNLTAALKVAEEALVKISDKSNTLLGTRMIAESALQALRQGKTSVPQTPPGKRIP